MRKFFTLFLISIPFFLNAQQITEIHYDNAGADGNERIEVTFPTGTDITGWNLVLYNGNDGAVYDTDLVSTGVLTSGGGFDIYVLTYSSGIQNGAPDGMALVNASNTVVQFLSYEGTFTATNGPANGTLSVNIGATESGGAGTTADGSIQFNSVTGVWTTNATQNSFGQLNSTVLPIKLESFTATSRTNTVNLDWKVSSEINISKYEVERSNNGTEFKSISSLSARNSANYSSVDNSPLSGFNYYRLKITENDGRFSYSDVQKVKVDGKSLSINAVYPNPASDNITLSINNNSSTEAVIQIIDFNGRIVSTRKVTIQDGLTVKTFNVSDLTSGFYVLRIMTKDETTYEKFVKL